jgi:hypothetical protein
MITVVVAVVASHVSPVVVSARAVLVAVVAIVAVAIVVNGRSSLASFDGVPGISDGPETTLDRRSRGSNSTPVPSIPRGRWVLVMRRGHNSLIVHRPLARREAFRLLCRHRLEEGLELLSHSPLLGGSRLRATAQ